MDFDVYYDIPIIRELLSKKSLFGSINSINSLVKKASKINPTINHENLKIHKSLKNNENIHLTPQEISNYLIFINSNGLNYDKILKYITEENINDIFNLLMNNENIINNLLILLPTSILFFYTQIDNNKLYNKIKNEISELTPLQIYSLLSYIGTNRLNYYLISDYINMNNFKYLLNLIHNDEEIRNNILIILPYEYLELYKQVYLNLDKNVELYKMMENYEPLELEEIYNLLIFINENNLNYDLISNYITGENIHYFSNLLDKNEDIRNNIIKLLPYEISEAYTTISKNIPEIYRRLRNERLKLKPLEIYYLLLYIYNNNLDYELISQQINSDNIKYLFKLLDDNEIIRNNLLMLIPSYHAEQYPNFDEESWVEYNFNNIKNNKILDKYIIKQYNDTY